MRLSVKKLFICMARNQMNDKDVLEKSGLSKATFNQVKNGSVSPKPATIGKIANALDIDVTELIEE